MEHERKKKTNMNNWQIEPGDLWLVGAGEFKKNLKVKIEGIVVTE